MSVRVLMVAVTAVVLCVSTACGRVDNDQHVAGIRALTADAPEWVDESGVGTQLWTRAVAFYEGREFQPAWIDGNRMTPHLEALVQQLHDSRAHGLEPERYGVEALGSELEASHRPVIGIRLDPDRVPELDVRFTYAYLQYAADLLGWGIDPRTLRPEWRRAEHDVDLGDALTHAVATGSVGETLAELAPTHPQYEGLQNALAAAQSGGERTRIALNLERWRWAPRDLGDRHILVNIPAYRLQVVEHDAEVLAMRVVVGTAEHETPVFSDRMTYLVFSPYWNIPASILREETLPRVREDPDYLERSRIEVLDASGDEEPLDPRSIDWSDEEETKGLRFRQVPGPENALGLVKFIFPNNFAVYLHDTPTAHLFEEQERAFSHGCVRVQEPVALAEYVLGDRLAWTPERITLAMQGDTEETVRLQEPLPVHLGYWTAWVEADGTVRYTSDPYGMDVAHAALRAMPLDPLSPPGAVPPDAPPAE